MKNITSIILASCLSVLVFVKSSQASTATYITNSVTTNGASYTAYVHSGSDWDSATAAVLAAINSTPVTNGDSGIVYRVPCDVLKSWGNPYGATYCTAVQTLSVDLRSYQSSNGYTRAWFEWTCHYAVGPGLQYIYIWGATPITIRFPVALGVQQSITCTFPNIPPPMPLLNPLLGYGGWACYDSSQSSTYPKVIIEQQTAEVRPNGDGEPAKVGEPIHVITGAASFHASDVTIPTPGLPLSFSRWYDSGNTNAGVLGKGWSCTLDCCLTKTNTMFSGTTNDWLVLGVDGQKYWKALSVTNGVHALVGSLDWWAAAKTDGSYDAILPQGVTYQFDTNGILTGLDTAFSNHVSVIRTNLLGQSLVTSLIHDNGSRLNFSYSSNQLVTVSTPSTNLTVQYAYDANGLLSRVTQTVANVQYASQYGYDSVTGVMTQRINAAGDVWTWGHNGNMTTNSHLGDSRWYDTSLLWNTNGLPQTTVTYNRDATSMFYSYEYDPIRLLVNAVYGPNPDGSANWVGTRYAHDDYGNVTQVEVADWRADVGQSVKVGMAYDSQNRLTNWALGFQAAPTNQWALSWNTNWATVASVTDPEGHRLECDYTNGLISVARVFLSTNQPLETRYAYVSNGLLSAVTNANGNWISFWYGADGNPTQVLSAAGTTNWMSWDNLGNLRAFSTPGYETDTNDPPNMIPRVTSFECNELGWIKKITYPDSSVETTAFDALGNVTNHIDASGRTNILTWLPTGKPASVSRFLVAGGSNQEAKISMDYDQQMHVLNIKDELTRSVEKYQLDLQDRPILVTNVEGQVMSLTWGVASVLNGMTRFDGTKIGLGYDVGLRLCQMNFADDTNYVTYFKNDLPKTIGNTHGVITNSFDAANRLVSQAQPVPSGNLAYGYYPAGQVSNVVSVAGTNTYALDAADRLQTLTSSSVKGQDTIGYAYDPILSLVTGVTCSNGLGCSYAYDIMNRVTGIYWGSVSNGVLRSRTYTYNPAGLISNITFESGERVSYSYDSLDRLTRERHTDYYGQVSSDEKYDYDLAGNRTRKTVLDANGNSLATVNYTTPTGNKLGSWTVAETNLAARITVAGSSSDPIGVGIRYGQLWVSNSPSAYYTPYVDSSTNFYAFDLVVGLGTQYVYAAIRDVAGNTSFATNRFYPTCITNGTYQYNAAGCLTNRQYTGKDYSDRLSVAWNSQYQVVLVSTNGGVAERYGYDAAGRRTMLVQGGVTNWMVYDGNQLVAEVDSSGNLKKTYVYGPGIDNLISMTVYGTTTNTYWFIRDHLGSTLALADSAGKIVESYRYDAWGRVLGVSGISGEQLAESAVGNRILWQGREYSWKTGLYYFRARWYDPQEGRWVSNDPIGISGGLNTYVFCGNNPVNLRDPLGLWGWDADIIQYGLGGLAGFGPAGTAGAAWGGFGEGWSRGGQGVINTFSGGLFNSKNGAFYGTFNQQWLGLGRRGNDCDEGFKTGATYGRVAECSLLAAGGAWLWETFGGATMDVAVGEGQPMHVAVGHGNRWWHVMGTIGRQRATSAFAREFVGGSWFQIFGIPVL